jgi:NADH-quinone oxidoreductase subunit D
MIRQLIFVLEGSINVDDRRCTLPEKRLVYTEIESPINHFKLIMDGFDVPPARSCRTMKRPTASCSTQSTWRNPAAVFHVRSPSFVHMGGVQRLLEGYQLADIIPTFGSVNMIGGE